MVHVVILNAVLLMPGQAVSGTDELAEILNGFCNLLGVCFRSWSDP